MKLKENGLLGAAHKSILSRITSIGRFQNTPTPLPLKRPFENRCNFSNHEKISNRCFAAYQMGLSANEVVSDVLSMTMLNENGQDMSLLSKFFHINNMNNKRKLQNKVSCRKFSGEMSIKQNFWKRPVLLPPPPQTSIGRFTWKNQFVCGPLTVLGDLVQFGLARFLLLTSIRTCIRMVTFQGKYSEICRSPNIRTNGGNKILLDIDPLWSLRRSENVHSGAFIITKAEIWR